MHWRSQCRRLLSCSESLACQVSTAEHLSCTGTCERSCSAPCILCHRPSVLSGSLTWPASETAPSLPNRFCQPPPPPSSSGVGIRLKQFVLSSSRLHVPTHAYTYIAAGPSADRPRRLTRHSLDRSASSAPQLSLPLCSCPPAAGRAALPTSRKHGSHRKRVYNARGRREEDSRDQAWDHERQHLPLLLPWCVFAQLLSSRSSSPGKLTKERLDIAYRLQEDPGSHRTSKEGRPACLLLVSSLLPYLAFVLPRRAPC